MIFSWLNSNSQKIKNNEIMNHFVLKTELKAPLKENQEEIFFGCGCFWGAEKGFWKLPGVITTAVGYAGGVDENPSYRSVCAGITGHTEAVRVTWNNTKIDISDLLKLFWECHDPTQGNRQGNDTGSQYRSVIYTNNDDDMKVALESKNIYQKELVKNNFKADNLESITTEIEPVKNYYLAEEYHQQYLAKNPNGYCGIGGTGCSFPKE